MIAASTAVAEPNFDQKLARSIFSASAGSRHDLALGRDHLALDGGAERARGLGRRHIARRRLMRGWLLHRRQPTQMW